MPNTYAVYKGEDLECMGTAQECAEILGISPETVVWYTYPTYQRRISKRKNPKNYRVVIKIEDGDE